MAIGLPERPFAVGTASAQLLLSALLAVLDAVTQHVESSLKMS
jgi:hypothetical protein